MEWPKRHRTRFVWQTFRLTFFSSGMSFRHLPKFLLQGQSTPTDTPLPLTTAEEERSSYPIRTSATVDRGIHVSKSEGNFLREAKEFAPTERTYHSGAVPVADNKCEAGWNANRGNRSRCARKSGRSRCAARWFDRQSNLIFQRRFRRFHGDPVGLGHHSRYQPRARTEVQRGILWSMSRSAGRGRHQSLRKPPGRRRQRSGRNQSTAVFHHSQWPGTRSAISFRSRFAACGWRCPRFVHHHRS